MSDANLYGYPAPVWQRFIAPDHAGCLNGVGVISARAGTPAAKSVLTLTATVKTSGVEAARFQAYGCPVVIAVGQWLAEQLEAGLPTGVPDAATIRAALEIPEEKAHCALMGEDVLQALWTQIR